MAFGIMVLLALAGGIWLTRPLWRGRIEAGQRRRAANVAAYRQRLGEIEADFAAGLLDAETAAGLRAELDSRLLRDAEAGDSGDTQPAPGRPLMAGLIMLFVLVLAVLGYSAEGTWKVQQLLASGAPVPAAGGKPGSVEEMVERLRAKLEQNPADTEGWAMLGRSEFVLQRYEESAKAYAKANELTGSQEPDLLVNEGEALALARDRDLLGRPQQLFDAALALSPEHSKALWYAGLAAEQAGDYAKALKRWTALSGQELPEELRPVLAERLQVAAQKTGGALPPLVVQAPAPAPGAAVPAAPDRASDVAIEVAVRVKPELAAMVQADAALFVFAKAASGPPMPLAVYRGKASELPREVRLDDSMGMLPTLKLSQFDQWTVTARLTRSGGVQAASGDLQGSLTVARAQLGKAAMVLTIDQVVP